MTRTTIRVLAASTGVTFKLSLLPSERTVANIRGHLAAAIPLQDQILLLGPPYKVPKDSTLQNEEVLNDLRIGDMEDEGNQILASKSGARRLFLFSKRSLSQQSPDPEPCVLQPSTLALPEKAPGDSPLNLQAQNPLHQALSIYERQFMLYLAQGRVLADGADLRLAAVRHCVQEEAVICWALRAAVSNLSDHFAAAARTRAEFSVEFSAKTSEHAKLLQKFEAVIADLAKIRLHPALIGVARSSGRNMETLLDTVPVDRERAWAQQCSESHQRLMTLFRELETSFGELGTPTDRHAETQKDRENEEKLQVLWKEVESCEVCNAQAERVAKLTNVHGEGVKIITNALTGESPQIQDAFTPLEDLSKSIGDLVPSMIEDDKQLAALMDRVADSKTEAMKRMKIRLREVSIAQSSIQRVLGSVGVLRDALTQQTENMQHLEHVAELEDSYKRFLSELNRRRAYAQAVTSSSVSMMETFVSMRDDEVKAREKFLRGPGRHLMPSFFETFAPTLATPPPLFTPQMPAMVELDTLPDVSDVPTSAEVSGDDSTTTSEMQQSVVRSASAISDDEQKQSLMAISEKHGVVSAEGSGTIVEAPVGAASIAAAEAQSKVLAYENSLLRQQLERLGGKLPRTHVESTAVSPETEIANLQRQIAQLKSSAAARSKPSDKIAHSSFDIGDVGLFMPTGRDAGGKRTYLAFHTNCPHRYLSTDCVKGSPDYVLGRIVYQEKLVAGEMGTDANPYGLHIGTPFFVLTVEKLSSSSKRK